MAQPPRFAVEFGKDGLPPASNDGRLDAPAFHRNHEAIAAVLTNFLEGHTGHVLEIGSGTGQHAVAFASQMPTITWWPTDLNDAHLHSTAAWRDYAKLGNLNPPVRLDASAPDWKLGALGLPPEYTLIFCANVIHISPWAVAEGIIAGADRHLRPGGELWLYGPFTRDGVHSAPSNAEFDHSLRQRNPEWGVRDTADLRALAARNNLRFHHIHELPSNNAIVTIAKSFSQGVGPVSPA
jgi:SAM-dependent methyltransferase